MSVLVRELNNVVEKLDEKDILSVIDFAKNLITIAKNRIDRKSNNCHRYGIADGLYDIPDDIDACNDEIAEMFGV